MPVSGRWLWALSGETEQVQSGGFSAIWAETQLLRSEWAKQGSGDTAPGSGGKPGEEIKFPYLGKRFWPEHLCRPLPEEKSR